VLSVCIGRDVGGLSAEGMARSRSEQNVRRRTREANVCASMPGGRYIDVVRVYAGCIDVQVVCKVDMCCSPQQKHNCHLLKRHSRLHPIDHGRA